jgi:hypothetical protein
VVKRIPARRRAGRPSVKPQPTGALLDGTFRWLKLDEKARSFRAMRAFALAAGPRIGQNARAERLRGAILFVRCSSSAWAQHLHAMKAQLLDKIARTPGGQDVRDIRTTVGPLDEVAAWDSLPAQPVEPDALPVKVPDEVSRAMADVRDPELRDHLLRLYFKLLKRS